MIDSDEEEDKNSDDEIDDSNDEEYDHQVSIYFSNNQFLQIELSIVMS